jgi:hypothetical protein
MPYDPIYDVTYITALNDPLEIIVSRGGMSHRPVCLWMETPDSSWPIALSDQQAVLLASQILAALADTEEPDPQIGRWIAKLRATRVSTRSRKRMPCVQR